METGKMLHFILLIGPWWISDQMAQASPVHHLCKWNLLENPIESGEEEPAANHGYRVNCSGLALRSVPSSSLHSLVKILDLSYNLITVIERADFCCHHTQLILSHNSIEKIDNGAFSRLHQLLGLNLSSNALRGVTERMFQGLRKLSVLDLRHNQLQWIHKTAFADLPQLEALWLQGNNIRTVPGAINQLTELKTLSLGANQLAQLQTRDLSCCPSLETLQLENNHISALADDVFQNHGHLKMVDLSSNHLRGLDDITVRQLWERGVDLRFHGNLFRCDCGSEQTRKGSVWLTDAVLCREKWTRYFVEREDESQRGEAANLRVHTTVTLNGVLGTSLTIPCGDNYNGVLMYWKTPDKWLKSRISCESHSDLRCSCDGSVTILNVTCDNTGLYYCFLEENHQRVIIPYRVSTPSNCHSSLPSKPRLTRDVRVQPREETVTEGHFTAVVASSVVLTFVVGLALGALSSPCLSSCLQKAKARFRRPGRNRSPTTPEEEEEEEEEEEDNNQISMEASSAGFTSFVTNGISSSDADDGNGSASVTPSPPVKAPRSFRSKVRQEESKPIPEGGDVGTQDGSTDTPPADDGDQQAEPSPADGLQAGEAEQPGESRPPPADADGSQDGSSDTSHADGDSETETITTGDNLPQSADDGDQTGEEAQEKTSPSSDSDGTQDTTSDTSQADGDRTQDASSEIPQGDDDQTPAAKPPGEDDAPKPQDQVAPRPARRGRVIRLYNYDEEGQPYGHIKEPEGANTGAPRPKQRTRSLNRLSAIMSSVEALDVSTSPRQQPTEEEAELGQTSDAEEDSVGGRLHVDLEVQNVDLEV